MKRRVERIVLFVSFLLITGCTKTGSGLFDKTPEGAINGVFTVNGHGDQVYFSKGNLQYQASTNTWRFAENQMDYVGGVTQYHRELGNVYENGIKCDNQLISSTYDGWIDLFGWATSGWDNNNLYYHPYDYESDKYSEYNGNGYGYFDGQFARYSMTGDQANCDWGVYNAISNGGNKPGLWRTLSADEWDYVFNIRRTMSGIRFAKAIVDEVNGFILLPDNWNADIFRLDSTNVTECDYKVNAIVPTDWNVLEKSGAVFIPSAGYRDRKAYYQEETLVLYLNHCYTEEGGYWSSSNYSYEGSCEGAFCLLITNERIIKSMKNRRSGYSVRLVCSAN